MTCKCSSKTGRSEYVYVICENCDESLIGDDGLVYPVHKTVVRVPLNQLKRWELQGYVFKKSSRQFTVIA